MMFFCVVNRVVIVLLFGAFSCWAQAAGGPLGIDHRIGFDQSGIWARHDQLLLQYATLGTVLGGALIEGGKSRLGRTYWQAVDSSTFGAISSTLLKEVFTRARPTQTADPNKWFQGRGHYSFPSGEVTFVTAAVTPFVLEYRQDDPAVYALEALPLYDGIARMKSHAHWQTDVLGGFALGTALGYYAHERRQPYFLSLLPDGFEVGLSKTW